MYQRLSKLFVGIVAAGVLAAGAYAQNDPAPQAAQGAAKQKAVKDQGEFDIYTAVNKENDPQKKLDLIKQWEQKYPDSDFKDDRTLLELNSYSAMASKTLASPTPENMDAGKKAAQTILDNMDRYFAPAIKPANVDDAQWQKIRGTLDLQAHTVLGYVAYQRKSDSEAEAEFRKVLAASPDSAQISYWLGFVIARQKKQERIPEALYHFARSVVVTGPQALDPTTKTAADKYLTGAYSGFHGSDEGLSDLKALAAKQPMPPDGWTLKSVVDIDKEKAGSEAEYLNQHPDIKLWRQIRDALKAPEGDKYFTDIKGSQIPPEGQAGFAMFKAKVVSQPTPKELLVNVDNAAGDATLKFESPLKTVDPGTALEFKGVVEALAKEPYVLTFAINDKADIKGLPAGTMGASGGAKKGPAKGPVRRKK